MLLLRTRIPPCLPSSAPQVAVTLVVADRALTHARQSAARRGGAARLGQMSFLALLNKSPLNNAERPAFPPRPRRAAAGQRAPAKS